jgi:two-component system CheB/CheR fusion protein
VRFALSKLIEEQNIKIKVDNQIAPLKAYPILFGRLLQNLIQNTIKYRSNKTSENDLYYLFSIADNGIGISERDFNRVFKIFQKVNNDDNDSHGIGLAICKKIVETHLGEIDIESQEARGSTFHFSISKKL